LGPAPVADVTPVLGAENITLEWTRPDGRIDMYYIKWYPQSNPDDLRTKELAGDVATEGIGRKVAVVIGDLHPGVQYTFEMATEAHGMRSTTVTQSVRTMPLITSEVSVANKPDVTDSISIAYTATPLTSSLFDTYRYCFFE
jgi:cadherin 5 type 2 (VE-cadherin)